MKKLFGLIIVLSRVSFADVYTKEQCEKDMNQGNIDIYYFRTGADGKPVLTGYFLSPHMSPDETTLVCENPFNP